MPVLLLIVFALVGCKHDDGFTPGDGVASPITEADITYAELARQYNQTVEPFGSLWARTDVVVAWRDADGESRREKGEGKFMMRRPDRTAFLVEKLGKTLLWAGSNESQYFLFDLVDGDNKTAYLGAFDQLDQPGRRAFPLPVRPDTMPALLGLTPLPQAESLDGEVFVNLYDGKYLVEIPGVRMLIDRETFRPTRIDLTDARGFSVLTAKLEGAFLVEVPGVRKTRWPSVCERAEIYVSGYESRLTIAMDFVTNNPTRVRDQMFDFETLKKAMKPDRLESLDK